MVDDTKQTEQNAQANTNGVDGVQNPSGDGALIKGKFPDKKLPADTTPKGERVSLNESNSIFYTEPNTANPYVHLYLNFSKDTTPTGLDSTREIEGGFTNKSIGALHFKTGGFDAANIVDPQNAKIIAHDIAANLKAQLNAVVTIEGFADAQAFNPADKRDDSKKNLELSKNRTSTGYDMMITELDKIDPELKSHLIKGRQNLTIEATGNNEAKDAVNKGEPEDNLKYRKVSFRIETDTRQINNEPIFLHLTPDDAKNLHDAHQVFRTNDNIQTRMKEVKSNPNLHVIEGPMGYVFESGDYKNPIKINVTEIDPENFQYYVMGDKSKVSAAFNEEGKFEIKYDQKLIAELTINTPDKTHLANKMSLTRWDINVNAVDKDDNISLIEKPPISLMKTEKQVMQVSLKETIFDKFDTGGGPNGKPDGLIDTKTELDALQKQLLTNPVYKHIVDLLKQHDIDPSDQESLKQINEYSSAKLQAKKDPVSKH